MKAVVLQPTYLPWMGYFGMIDVADIFVFYDDVQFSVQSWQQRNRIRSTNRDWMWLSVPVIHKFGQMINEVRIDNSGNWRKKHWSAVCQNYAKAPYFREYEHVIGGLFEEEWTSLSELNVTAIERLTRLVGVHTPTFARSSDIEGIDGSRTDRLLLVLEQVHADEYVSGPGARDYLEVEKFRERGIRLYWYDFRHPVYPQTRDDFMPYLSAIDLLFNTGSEAISYVRQGSRDALEFDTRSTT